MRVGGVGGLNARRGSEKGVAAEIRFVFVAADRCASSGLPLGERSGRPELVVSSVFPMRSRKRRPGS